MMKTLWQTLAPIAILLFLFSCKNEDLTIVDSKSSVLRDTILIYKGDSTFIRNEDITISFNRVISDSRCPIGVECVWAGEVIGEFRYTKGSYSVIFNATNGYSVFVDGYSVKLIDVLPYPRITNSVSPLYSAKIVVAKPLHTLIKGTAKNYTGLDGCGFVVELDNGSKLEPINCSFGFKNNQRVALFYNVLYGVMTTCMVGQPAHIDEIYELVE